MDKEKRGAICPGLGTPPQRAICRLSRKVRNNGTAAKLAAASDFGRHHPGTAGGIIPEGSEVSQKRSPG